MSKSLFENFDEVSSKEWKQKIQMDLKGKDYNETLLWLSAEGITIKPFYNKEDLKGQPHTPLSKGHPWYISKSIFVKDEDKSVQNAKQSSSGGVESIKFQIPEDKAATKLLNPDLLNQLVCLQIMPDFLSAEFVSGILKQSKDAQKTDCKTIIHTDIIGQLITSGNWYKNLDSDFAMLGDILEMTKGLTVNLELYQNAGGTIIQQLAYGIGHINEYLNYLDHNNRLNFLKEVHFNIAIGANYFFEIAKIRSLRQLWKSLNDLYKTDIKCYVHAVPSKRNKTIYDYNSNMLRTTTECMSAILGGADFIENQPYDFLFNKANEFGDRIAKNQLLILRHESHFDKVSNVAEGSYYIETLTNQFSKMALDLFKDIEQNSGFLKQIKEGTIQRKINESAKKEQKRFDELELKSVGTNFVVNKNDKMCDNLELYPFIKKNPRKTLIEPLIERRLSEKIERIRLESESE